MKQLSKEEKVKCYKYALKQLRKDWNCNYTCIAIKQYYRNLVGPNSNVLHVDEVISEVFPEYLSLIEGEIKKHGVTPNGLIYRRYGLECIAMVKQGKREKDTEIQKETLPIRERLLKEVINLNS